VRTLLISIVAASLLRSAAAAPCVIAPVSAKDVSEIRRLVRTATRDHIICIFAVSTDAPLPGSVTGIEYQFDLTTGARKDRYTRTDCASVHVGGLKRHTGDAYEVQKLHGRWKITSKGYWDM
jgi:hypothetical protein